MEPRPTPIERRFEPSLASREPSSIWGDIDEGHFRPSSICGDIDHARFRASSICGDIDDGQKECTDGFIETSNAFEEPFIDMAAYRASIAAAFSLAEADDAGSHATERDGDVTSRGAIVTDDAAGVGSLALGEV